MESRDAVTSDEARAALEESTGAQQRIAARVTSPWWYRLGAGLCTASLFIGTGLVVGRAGPGDGAETASTLLVVVGAIVGPIALLSALKRSTGVSVDRYSDGMGAWYVTVFALFALAFALQQFAGVPVALPVASIGAFVVTVLSERRLDTRLRLRVQAGGVRR